MVLGRAAVGTSRITGSSRQLHLCKPISVGDRADDSAGSLGPVSMYTADAHLPKWGNRGAAFGGGGKKERKQPDMAVWLGLVYPKMVLEH